MLKPVLARTDAVNTQCNVACQTRSALQGGTVVNADDEQQADVLIKDCKIVQVASGLKVCPTHTSHASSGC